MQYLEAGLNQDWNLYPSGGRELDQNKVNEYLKHVPEEYLEAIMFILDNTQYVTFDTFAKRLQESFDNFVNEIGNQPFYLVYPQQGKVGSENWLVHLLYLQIRNLNLVGVLDNSDNILSQVPDGSNILLVDDAIYSGCNMAGTIDGMTYPDARSGFFTFHLVVPYTRRAGRDTIMSVNSAFKYNFYSTEEMIDIGTLSNNDPEIAELNKTICSESDPVPIYFDWKVANEFGSYPQLYLHGVIPEPSTGLDLMNEPENVHLLLPPMDDCDWKRLQRLGSLLRQLPTREPINRVADLILWVDSNNTVE